MKFERSDELGFRQLSTIHGLVDTQGLARLDVQLCELLSYCVDSGLLTVRLEVTGYEGCEV